MAASIDQTVQSLDALAARMKNDFAWGTTETAPPSKPFDIADYVRAAEEITEASTNITVAIQSLELLISSPDWSTRSTEVNTLLDRVELGGRHLVHHAFLQGAILIAVFLVGLVAALLIYRLIATKWPSR